jgi:hypothetical protein
MTEHIVEIKENIAVDDSVDAKVERVMFGREQID